MDGYNGFEEIVALQAAPMRVPTCVPSENATGVIRIWLVDDSGNFRMLLASLLNDERGFDASRQFDSPDGVLKALACEAAPDVILLDIQMGPYNGLDAIRPIKALAPDAHVLMLTTLADRESRERAFREGASDFMLKSWELSEIVMHIRRAMELGPAAGLVTAFINRSTPSTSAPRMVSGGERAENSGPIGRGIIYLRDLFKMSHAE